MEQEAEKRGKIISYRILISLLPEATTQSKFAFCGHVTRMAWTWRPV